MISTDFIIGDSDLTIINDKTRLEKSSIMNLKGFYPNLTLKVPLILIYHTTVRVKNAW